MNEIRRALYQVLAADATLDGLATGGIHHRTAFQGAAPPYVIFHRQSETAIWSMTDAIENDLWLVKGVCRGGDAGPAEDIADRVRDLLDDASLTVAGRDHLYLRHETGVDYGENDGGELYHHAGSVFRLVTELA